MLAPSTDILHPVLCRLFGEEEEIRGYDGLSIDIFVTPRLQPLVRPLAALAQMPALALHAALAVLAAAYENSSSAVSAH